MMMTLRAYAILLSYPSAELQAHVGELRSAFAGDRALPNAELRRIESLLAGIESGDLIDLQAQYSELFDRSRSLSLHLFEHVHGDGRERGQAMIDLGEQYLQAGIFLDATELPDFIPVFLEYASCLPPEEARATIGQPAHVFAALAERLDKRESPYAAIFHGLGALAGAQPDGEAMAELRERAAEDDKRSIDEEWEEAPVTFSGAHDMGGPTGVVAKIRASNRAMNKETGQ